MATGAGFICFLTDRGIIMTKGSAESGCLGKLGIFVNLQSNFETFTQVEKKSILRKCNYYL